MNPLQDNPHFTAYALGELSGEEARAMHEMLATTPAAAHELEQIEAVTDALRHGAPIPLARLSHEQRHAVLHPSNLPRRIQPMMPRQPRKPAPQLFWPVMGTLAKIAAVLALTGAAFFAGWSFAPDMRTAAEHGTAADPVQMPDAAPQLAATAQSAEKAAPKTLPSPAPVVAVAPAPAVTLETVEKKEVKVVAAPPAPAPAAVAMPVPAPEVAVAKAAPAAKSKAPAAPVQGFAMVSGHGSFVSTTKQVADQFSLHPAQLRPPPPAKPKGEIFASPAPPAANTKAEAKAERPSLYIHSWKAEVASCPWNPAHRLMRVVIQIPADQSAVLSSDTAFPVQVSFDQANVKQYRMLCERHLAAPERRSAGSHVLWYEFQPNGTGESAHQVATVTLPNSHFTSQAVGPFDSSKLQVIDRGYSLLNAREDFVFETSVVGFGLLLRGADHLGSLNHDLVLNLAKQAQGSDTSGERTRFIHLVQDARRATGL